MNNITAALRMVAFVAGTIVLLPVHLLVVLTTGSVKSARLWHTMACCVFSLRVRHVGVPAEKGARPTVFLANHLSYLDIIALGARLDAVFVAKSEVAGWPAFGFLAKSQRTIFIERKRTALDASREKLAGVLRRGENIILFGEGTSTDGRGVQQFKAGLLEILYSGGVDARLQPVAIVLERAGGQPVDAQDQRDLYSWWRPETTLAPHLWAFAKAGGADVSIHYLPPLNPADFAERKDLANTAQAQVLEIVSKAGAKGTA